MANPSASDKLELARNEDTTLDNSFSDDKENLLENIQSDNVRKRKFPIVDINFNNKLSKLSQNDWERFSGQDATFIPGGANDNIKIVNHTVTSGEFERNHTVTSGEFERSLIEDKVSELDHRSGPNESASLPYTNVCPEANPTFGEVINLNEFVGKSNSTSVQKEHSKSNSTIPNNYLEQELTGDIFEQFEKKLENPPKPDETCCEEKFIQLLSIFPDIDQEFLNAKCRLGNSIEEVADSIIQMIDYPKHNNVGINQKQEKSHQIPEKPLPLSSLATGDLKPRQLDSVSLVSSCGTMESNPIQNSGLELKESAAEKTTQHSNSGLSFLLQIFPDADPLFLESKANLKEHEMDDFISQALEKKDYPKLLIKEEQKEEPNEIKLYTTNFNVEQFVNNFQDPSSFFLDENRICNNNNNTVEYLKKRYRNHAIKLIQQKYRDCKYNLTKTCEFLDTALPSRTTKRTMTECHVEESKDLKYLQEVCFIEHKDEIINYIEKKKEEKRLAFETAQSRGELIECNCCYQEVMFEDCGTCNEGDIFCKECIKKSVEIKIGDGLTKFPCLLDCGSEFSLKLLQDLLEEKVFSRLLVRVQSDEVRAANIEGLEVCPFCEYATIPPPETNIFVCKNPDCLKDSCRKCFKVNHIPLRCEEIETDDQAKARKYIEDEMTRALVRECYKCKKNFIKLDGCNKMTCTCGAKMCYICRQPITDYSHFNGPAGSENQKCPLYSSDKVLNVEIVKAVAEEALNKVKADNPDMQLKYDPSKLLPTMSGQQPALPPGVVEQPANVVRNMILALQGEVPVIVPQENRPVLPPPPRPMVEFGPLGLNIIEQHRVFGLPRVEIRPLMNNLDEVIENVVQAHQQPRRRGRGQAGRRGARMRAGARLEDRRAALQQMRNEHQGQIRNREDQIVRLRQRLERIDRLRGNRGQNNQN